VVKDGDMQRAFSGQKTDRVQRAMPRLGIIFNVCRYVRSFGNGFGKPEAIPGIPVWSKYSNELRDHNLL
jgi:hypothetical protein